ncbi:adenylate/guanylate cyclase domain-containing protein [Gordonia sp. TBRC 11910]|uniref:Adenylate/guanylate cyclase domain-containing protein n=1 Tax=Gordonia asplenii TaxID=2725283 RepID=A0A848KPZ3_9ACTN|nr:adenylate/guanylate cyclase domain-containing protein [Gordonia asplenii]NMO00017.1 adenylate/guanylate cyclase domain-containing protein [Gordonia asplenii]
MTEDLEPDPDAVPQTQPRRSARRRAVELIERADSSESAVRMARTARSMVAGSPITVNPAERTSDRLARLIDEANREQPSAVRELGLATVQVWQNLTRRRANSDEPVPTTILFTDLVAFSTWALAAGDDQVLKLLSAVNTATSDVVRQHGGQVVKGLGDGTMAVFADAGEAIIAAHETIQAVNAITIDDYRPQLRAGVHTGAPRAVGDDFLGVDVNIAARVAAAAGAGEVFASDRALAECDPEAFSVRRKRFKAKGVPKELKVFSVVPRYSGPPVD